MEEDILNAYCFLCNNYNFGAQNDEIILIGFSRGAFTVRCLADFISQVGLLQRKTLPFLSVLFQRWMDAKEEADRETMKAEIRKMQQTFSVPVKITVLAEWDTGKDSGNHFLPVWVAFRARGFLFGLRRCLVASEILTNHVTNGTN